MEFAEAQIRFALKQLVADLSLDKQMLQDVSVPARCLASKQNADSEIANEEEGDRCPFANKSNVEYCA